MISKNRIDPECITYSQMNMIFNARVYYRRLAAWTRSYLLSRYFGIGTAEELFGSLFLETLDIGDMMQIFFGREVSAQYGQLLSRFAFTLRDLINAQLEGNTEAIDQNLALLYRLAEERAEFTDRINPYWTGTEYENLFETYIQYVTGIANALAAGNYSSDIELYDLLTAHTDLMGDVFADGVYDYITSGQPAPDQLLYGVQCITLEQMNDIYAIRMIWFDFVTWIRNYMLSRYLGLGNAEEVKARLMQVPVAFVNVMREYFGDLVAEDYLRLFYTYIDLIEAFITAQMEGNTEEIGRITRLLYQNADERAAFAASLYPAFWDERGLRDRLYTNLRSTLDQSTTFLTGDYARNIDIFSRLLDQAESTGNYLTQGLFHYLIFQA